VATRGKAFKSDRCGIEIYFEFNVNNTQVMFKSDRCGIEMDSSTGTIGLDPMFKSDRCGIEIALTGVETTEPIEVQIRPLRD